MSLTIEITGLPNIGKSTLLNTLTRATALTVNYLFATIESNVGVVPLSDTRLDRLAELFYSAKVVPTTISFVGIAGIMRDVSQGEGLGNQFLANIRETDAICLVTHTLVNPDVIHVESRIDLKGDTETATTGLVLTNVRTLERQIPRLTKEVASKKTPKEVLEAAEAVLELLEQGKALSAHGTDLDPTILRGFGLMTTKKLIYVFNIDNVGLADETMRAELRDFVTPAEAILFDAKFEAELVELEPEEARGILEASGQDETRLDKPARVDFDTLGLQAYPTAGKKEARAWTIHEDWTASQATGVIHTDLERGFIKAEIIGYDDLVEYGGLAEARAHDRVRMEGKNYVMASGDVVEFRTGLTSKK